MNPLFLNTVLLGGDTSQKLHAAGAAGFQQVEIWRQDVEAYPPGPANLEDELRTQGLGLTDYQVLLDFDGAPAGKREAKRREALAMLETAVMIGASTVLTPASTDPDCDPHTVIDDMAWLAKAAAIRGLRIAYEAMAWSTINHTLPAAWGVVRQVNARNLGLVVDAFHIFARRRDVSDLDGIPTSRIFLVQLSDLNREVGPETVIDVARHRRLLPGQGRFALSSLLEHLDRGGYAGPIGLEVFNDALKARDPMSTAVDAMAALRATLSNRPHTAA